MSKGRDYLEYVKGQLIKRIEDLGKTLQEGQDDIHKMNEYFWENYTEMDEYGYENYDNQQQLFRQSDANYENKKLMLRLQKMQEAPFFGSVSFCYEDEDAPEDFFIGIGNFSMQNGDQPLIYDWRAPVSSLFYDYDAGPAAYTAHVGEISGTITEKSQYKIRRGQMVYEFTADTKIDDEILKEELGKHGDTRLKNIIRTIQKEQNQIIRNTEDKIMVIQGAAGSGKTSIALHRIAYLLYHDRKRLSSSQVLILSPNAVFSDYISHILPELGEERIREMSLDIFAYHELKDYVHDCEDSYDQLERMMRQDKRPAGRRAIKRFHEKQSKAFVNKLDAYVAHLGEELLGLRDFSFRGRRYKKLPDGRRGLTMTEAEIRDLFFHKFSSIPLLSRMDAVAEKFIDDFETLFGGLIPEDRDLIMAQFRDMYHTRNLCEIYALFLEKEHIHGMRTGTDPSVILEYEDVYPLLYLKFRLLKSPSRQPVRHLVIDEMQDYSYIQYRILTELFPCSKTILGDRAQTLTPDQSPVMDFLPELLGSDYRFIELNRSYRSTTQICGYASQICHLPDIRYFDRQGKDVVFYENMDMTAMAGQIHDELRLWEPTGAVNTSIHKITDTDISDTASTEAGKAVDIPYETAAVLTFNRLQAIEVAELLGKLRMDVHYMDRDTATFSRGVTVTPWYLAKGLEFDQVFVLPADHRSSFYDRYQYIAATRALHELYIFR